jgi:glycosyltransferase involved in cell wall biosynthesis
LNILLVTTRYPWPPRRGDQLRTVQMLDLLSGEHAVTLLTPAPRGRAPVPPPRHVKEIQEIQEPVRIETYESAGVGAAAAGFARAAVGGWPLQSGLFHLPGLGRRLRALAPRADLAVMQLARLAIHLDDFGATPLLIDLIDSLSLNLARRAACDRSWLRPLLRLEAGRLARAETRLAARARAVVVVSERDRLALAGSMPAALAGRLGLVGLAVEPGAHAEHREPRGGGPVLAITGNLGYFVNADAVLWWLGAVWPLLRARRPDVRLEVAGDRPRPAVRRAVARAGALLIESPADLRQVLAGATIALAPLRCGSGVPLKVLEAWAAGIPVVATPWAAAGTSGRPGEDLRVAERPREWVETLLDLLDDPAARRRLAENGRRRLAADYSRAAVGRQLAHAIELASSG